MIGVIGGSGLYELLDDAVQLDEATPYGPPSSPISMGRLAGREVAFLTRHGRGHTVAPHRIPARANVWALARLGATALVTSSAVGGLTAEVPPGSFVVPDQLLDATAGSRPGTFFDGDPVQHLAAPDPFDPVLRRAAVAALTDLGVPVHDGGTCVVIPGPRFSTRAESRFWAAAGGTTVNMTLAPETSLALELGLGVVNVSFVTDSDAAVPREHSDAVSAELVFQRLAAAQPVIRAAIERIVAAIPADYRADTGVAADAIAAVLRRPTTTATTATPTSTTQATASPRP